MKDPGVNPIGAAPGETSLTLLEKVRRQDQAAWHRLVALYTPLVYHWCKSAGLQQSDAEDVGQQVFLAVSGAVGRFHRDQPGDSFRGWLRTITKRKIRDHGRSANRRAVGGGDAHDQMLLVAAEPEPDPDARTVEDNILYRRAVELVEAGFEPSTRQAFWLVVGGRSAADVAAELRITRGAVYVAKSKVLKRLRDEFGDLLGPGPVFHPQDGA